jgi:nitrate/nitrite transporter NarK
MFGSFVISSLSLAMMLTSFFTDHKIASEIIGMIFSMAAFLPLLHSG